jgi:hypothetical protein
MAAIRFAYDTGLVYRTTDAGPTQRAVQGGEAFLSEDFDPSAPAGPPNGAAVKQDLSVIDNALDAPGRRLKILPPTGAQLCMHACTRAAGMPPGNGCRLIDCCLWGREKQSKCASNSPNQPILHLGNLPS